MDDKTRRKKVLQAVGLIGLFILIFGLSYAIFTVTLNGTKKVKIKTGRLELQLLDENNNDITNPENAGYVINLDNAVPVSDEEGLQSQAFTFKLKNNGTIPTKYTIYLDDVALDQNEERLDDQYIRYSLTKNGSSEEINNLTKIGSNPNRKLDSGLIKESEINTYTLKVWIKQYANNNAMDKVFHATLRVEGSQYLSPFNDAPMADQLYAKDNVGTLTAPIKNTCSSTTQEGSGIYKYTDSKNITTYVYRGTNDLNNYVSFANQIWRIIRIQEDGTIKIIRQDAINYENSDYDYGSSIREHGVQYRKVQYNKSFRNEEDNIYSGSNIEGYLNAWYQDTMMDYDNKIEENMYCSDRSEIDERNHYEQTYYSSWTHIYGIYNNIEINNGYWFTPTVSCNSNDEVDAKVALLTIDEYVLAGGDTSCQNNYLLKGYYYWTMSPIGYDGTSAKVYRVNYDGSIGYTTSHDIRAVVPVITLKANTTIASGNGTSEHPYVID